MNETTRKGGWSDVGRFALKVAAVSVFAVGAYAGLMWRVQPKLLYYPRKYSSFGMEQAYKEAKVSFGRQFQPVQDIVFEMEKSGVQKAFFLPSDVSKPRTLWVVFGGNAMLALDWLDVIQSYRKHSRSDAFLLIDYCGYGDSSGTPNPDCILKTSREAFRRVKEENSFESVGTLCFSLGCAAGIQFAKHESSVESCVLLAPFSSVLEVAQYHNFLPRLFPEALAKSLVHPDCNWDNKVALQELLKAREGCTSRKLQVNFLHGQEDEICPALMSEELFEIVSKASNDNVQTRRVVVPAADHNQLFQLGMHEIIQLILDSNPTKH